MYVAGTRTLFCLSAADGADLWKAPPLRGGEISSSPLVVDGVAVILGGQLMGFDADNGSNLWTVAKTSGNNPSPVLWTTGDVNLVIANSGAGLTCVEPRTGAVRWTVAGGGSGSPVVSGDMVVLQSDNRSTGLVVYQMSTGSAQKIWSCPLADRGTTPIVWEGHVYVNGSGKTACLRLANGSIKWEQTHGCEIASPILADGKILATLGNGNPLLMIGADTDKYQELAKANFGVAACSSPAISDGRLYLRLTAAVACYDLTRSP